MSAIIMTGSILSHLRIRAVRSNDIHKDNKYDDLVFNITRLLGQECTSFSKTNLIGYYISYLIGVTSFRNKEINLLLMKTGIR